MGRYLIIATMLISLGLSSSPVEQLKALLPVGEETEPWQPKGDSESYIGEELYNLINGGAEIFLEYGFTEAIAQEYSKGTSSLRLTIFRMKNPEAAFGIYSLNRMRMSFMPGIGDEGVGDANYIYFWQGSQYVTVEAFPLEKGLKEALLHLASLVSAKIEVHASPPVILNVLPQKNRIERSECLVKGFLGVSALFYLSDIDIFQLGPQATGIYGEYQFPGEKMKLFIARYANPDKVEVAWQRLQQALNREEGFIPSGEIDHISLWDKEGRFYASLKATDAIAVVLDAGEKSIAIDLLKQIK